jgi:taurine dioxygenase
MRYPDAMGLSIRNLAMLGSEILGLDLSKPLAADDRAAIADALDTQLVVVARDQRLSDPELIAFSRNFGELDPPGPNPYGEPFNKEFPEINVISNVIENGRPIGGLGAGEAVWHADMTYTDVPPKAAILHALEIPADGGNTYFADMYAAYDALPSGLKAAVASQTAVHDASRNSAGLLRKGYAEVRDVRETVGARHPLMRRDVRETVGARHPLMRTDPASGRTALFLGRRHNSYVVGLEVADSEALLGRLWAHATQTCFTMCHQWRAGDLLMWNNRAVLHRRDPFDENARRIMHRTQIKGANRIA